MVELHFAKEAAKKLFAVSIVFTIYSCTVIGPLPILAAVITPRRNGKMRRVTNVTVDFFSNARRQEVPLFEDDDTCAWSSC
jgi:hypothetical protein